METRQRTVVKALLWTLLGLVMMALIGLMFTGSIAVGGLMALINSCIGLATYMVYERIWAAIHWGRQ